MNAIPRLLTGFDSPMASLTSLMATLRSPSYISIYV